MKNDWNDWLAHRQHKYIKKIGSGPNARYFYTQDELRAYYDKQTLTRRQDNFKKEWSNRQKVLNPLYNSKFGKTKVGRKIIRSEAKANLRVGSLVKEGQWKASMLVNRAKAATAYHIAKGRNLIGRYLR